MHFLINQHYIKNEGSLRLLALHTKTINTVKEHCKSMNLKQRTK